MCSSSSFCTCVLFYICPFEFLSVHCRGFGIRVQRGSTSFILSPVLSDAPPEIVGLISRGDNNRVTFWSGPLQANDVIQLTYIVNTASGQEPSTKE